MKAYIISHFRRPMEVDVDDIDEDTVTITVRPGRTRVYPRVKPLSSHHKTREKALIALNEKIDRTIQDHKDEIKRLNNIKKIGGLKRSHPCPDLDKKDFRNMKITKDSIIMEIGLSTRALNALKANITPEHEALWGWKDCRLTVGHYEGTKQSTISHYRNMGKKTLSEIERAFAIAGVKLL